MTSGKAEDADGQRSERGDAGGVRGGEQLFSTQVWLALIVAVIAIAALVTFHVSGSQSLQFSHDGKTVSVSLKREPLTAEALQKLLAGGGENPDAAQIFKAILAQAGYVSVNEKPQADAVERLKRHGLYSLEESGIADQLAQRFEALYGGSGQQDLIERHKGMEEALKKLPSLNELRRQAQVQERPFQPIAIGALASKPGMSARPACNEVVKVSRAAWAGTVVTLVNPKDQQRTLTVRALPGVPDVGEHLLFNLSEDQFKTLGLIATESVSGLQGEVAKLLVLPVRAGEAGAVPANCSQVKQLNPSAARRTPTPGPRS